MNRSTTGMLHITGMGLLQMKNSGCKHPILSHDWRKADLWGWSLAAGTVDGQLMIWKTQGDFCSAWDGDWRWWWLWSWGWDGCSMFLWKWVQRTFRYLQFMVMLMGKMNKNDQRGAIASIYSPTALVEGSQPRQGFAAASGAGFQDVLEVLVGSFWKFQWLPVWLRDGSGGLGVVPGAMCCFSCGLRDWFAEAVEIWQAFAVFTGSYQLCCWGYRLGLRTFR